MDVHLWDAGGSGPNRGWCVGRSGGISAAANGGQRVTKIQSSAKASPFLTLQSQTASANLLAIHLTFSTQIGANL